MTKQTIIARLDRVLKPVGFVRRKARWNRRVDVFVDVIDLQISKDGDTITVNAGVLDTVVHVTLWGGATPAFVDETLCTVRARIGALIDDKDKWWELGARRSADDIADEVSARVLPFLERLHSREAMERWLTEAEVVRKHYPPPILSLAILKSLLGRTEEACAVLAQLREDPAGAWQTRFTDVAARLGCE